MQKLLTSLALFYLNSIVDIDIIMYLLLTTAYIGSHTVVLQVAAIYPGSCKLR